MQAPPRERAPGFGECLDDTPTEAKEPGPCDQLHSGECAAPTQGPCCLGSGERLEEVQIGA